MNKIIALALFSVFLCACSNDSGGPAANQASALNPDCDESFESTFEAIQQTIFERKGCTEGLCHSGASPAGGLDLSASVAYANLYNQASSIGGMPRVKPGRTDESLLFLKLAAATLPDRYTTPGTPMPFNQAPLTEDELELVRLWIYSGAPETGVIESTIDLIDACLPDPEPITIEPLPKPDPATGIQLVMPPFELEPLSETEVCLASYYDFTDVVPEKYKDSTGTKFRYRGFEMRQDPQSHHLVLFASNVTDDRLHDEYFKGWICRGGELAGESCEPTDATNPCGESGVCSPARIEKLTACTGYGPPDLVAQSFRDLKPEDAAASVQGFGGGQRAQLATDFGQGVYAEIPLKGVIYWNSHAFNLTKKEHMMHARLNYYFADEQNYMTKSLPIHPGSLYQAAGTAPFTEAEYCNEMVMEQGAHLTELTQHTHRFGKHFAAWLPDGSQLYENFVYNDPIVEHFDPPLVFDNEDPAERTIKFCGRFNNGMNADGSPNVETVTRRSRTPENQLDSFFGACKPTACVTGNIGAPCNGTGDDAACDSAPGAGDGFCDACPIQAGISTENSMFLLLGRYYVPDVEED